MLDDDRPRQGARRTDSSPRLTRRHALRLLTGSVLTVAGATLVSPESVAARRVWCRTDPTFRVNGIVGNVYVSGELDVAYDTTGPIQLTFYAPTGSVVELLAVDPDFGHGYAVTIAYDDSLKNDDKAIGLAIEVVVPSVSDELAILVEFVPDGTILVADKKVGATNQVVRVKTELRKPESVKGLLTTPTTKSTTK